MRSLGERLQAFRNRITNYDPSLLPSKVLQSEERVTGNSSKEPLQTATTVFDESITAKNPRHLDNHLSANKAEIKVFESSPKLR